jgi:peptidoglycan hydrolase CwlO-like protein
MSAETGCMPALRHARPRAAIAATLALAVTIGLTSPAEAASLAQLRRARDKLQTLTDRIADRQRAAARIEERLTALDTEIDRVVTHLAVVRQVARSVQGDVEQLEERLEVLRRRLNELVSSAYMNQPSGQMGMVLGLILGSRSVAELTDGIEYASRIASQTQEAASELTTTKTRLAERLATLKSLASDKADLLGTLTRQRRRGHALEVRQRRALRRLNATREQIVGVVRSLRRELAWRLYPLVGNAFQGGAHTSYGRWSALFLRSIHAPACQSNQVVIVAWQLAEFTQAGWNPLATTRPMAGSTSFNSAGVQNFPSLQTGLLANRLTLYNGWRSYGYGAIVSNLRACSPPYTTANAIRASRWCHGCAGGGYVVNKIGEVAQNFDLYARF